jgi:PAS domain S-box-containing protein
MRAPTAAESIRVLHVDDDPDIAALTATYLEREDDRFVVETATSADEGLARLAETAVDCIVSDYDMPGRNGIEFLEAVREAHPDLPFVLYTGKGGEEVASDAISAGVTDYLQKEAGTSQYAVLANRVANAVERHRSRSALESSQQRLSLFVEQSPLGVVEYDEEFTIVGLNPAGEEILGYDEADLVGHTWETLVTEESYDNVDRVTDELARGEGGWHSVDENVRADGEVIVCEWHNRVVTDDDGEVVAVFSQFQDVTDRVERERELRQYEAYIEGSTDIITALDDTGVIQYQSPSVTRILGYDHGGLVGENGFEYFHPDDRQAAFEAFTRIVENPDEVATVEARFRTADGEWRRLEISGRNLLDDPDVGAIITNSRDVTDRARRTEELSETNALLSTLVERLPVGVLAEDADRNVLAVNDRLLELFGVDETPEETVGTDCAALADRVSDQFTDPEEFVDRIEELVADSEPVRAEELTRRDGRTFARSHDPLALPDGPGHLWVYRDVTESAARERRLAALNETSRELMEADSREAVVAVGVEAAREVLGLDANAIHLVDDEGGLAPAAVADRTADLVGDPPTFTGGDSIAWDVYQRGEARAVDDVRDEPNVYREDTPVRGELYVPIGDHGVLIAGSRAPEAFDQQDVVYGEILAGNIAVALDQVEQTAELRSRERELTRKNARLEEFASVVSHDLRNPLNIAQGRVDLVREEHESEDLDRATTALDRCRALVDDLLVLARGGEAIGELETVDLGSFARQCWETAATADATLDVAVARSVRADRSRLRQLLENLFRNAVEHGSTGSQTLSASDDAVGHGGGVRVRLEALPDGFAVVDDGPGIDPAVREEVFDTGYSTKPEGTGLGLDIVTQVAEAHGWTVEVTESETGGARVVVRGVEFVD